MPDINELAQMIKEISEIIEQGETPQITLSVPSMLKQTPENIKLEVEKFNSMMDYLIANGKQCEFITAEQNESISYEELMFLEDIVNETKREIQDKDARLPVEKARIIEHIVSRKFQTLVGWGDEDFYSACDKNLVQALKENRGSCCHFAALTQYLHLRNNMYSDIIFSRVNVGTAEDGKIMHMFNLLFLNDLEKWTFVDTMWEKYYLRLREQNRFSFVSLEAIQNDPSDVDKAHTYIEQDISGVPTVAINMGSIDRKQGNQNKIYLFPYCFLITNYIANGNFEKAAGLFSCEDKIVQSMENKNTMIQFIGLVTYMSAIELGQTGLARMEERQDEDTLIRYLDTYLKEILPQFYAMFFDGRIKINNPRVLDDNKELEKYATSLFQVITKEDGSVGVCFDDRIDSAYIGVSAEDMKSKGIPRVEVLNKMQFEERFGKIQDRKDRVDKQIEHEYK